MARVKKLPVKTIPKAWSAQKLPRTPSENEFPKRSFRSGEASSREARHRQLSTDLSIPRVSFQRVVREISQRYNEQIKFMGSAVLALQEASEAYAVSMFSDADLCREHRGRETLTIRDLRLAARIGSHRAVCI
jgi:histone H3/H4